MIGTVRKEKEPQVETHEVEQVVLEKKKRTIFTKRTEKIPF